MLLFASLGGCAESSRPEVPDADSATAADASDVGTQDAEFETDAVAPTEDARGDAEQDVAEPPDTDEDAADTASTGFAYEPAGPVFSRLTQPQYRSTIDALFGSGLASSPLEADTNPYLFYTIGGSQTVVSASGVELYANSAFQIAAELFADPVLTMPLFDCTAAEVDAACFEAFIRTQGRRIFRRPLGEPEVARWVAVASEIAGDEHLVGAEFVIAGMLQSPHFLYRAEIGEPDPGDPTQLRYTSWEMAERLSYLIWNSTPDDELLNAAARGELLSGESIETQVARMLADPRARAAAQEFFSQYLDLGRLGDVERDLERYPEATPSLFSAMETELQLLVDDVVFRQDADIRQLFSDRRGYVNSELADLYGIDAPGASEVAFVPVEFGPEVPRAGILTLGAFLTMNAHETETSPTLRGKYVRERVLCMGVPAPPDDIDLNLAPQEDDPPTLRERLEQHRVDPVCAGCHSFIDPPGFLFEHYDSLGRYRDEAEGFPINAAGALDGVELNHARDLAEILRYDERVANCVARQLYRHANGRVETLGERQTMIDLQEDFASTGYRFQGLIRVLALSEGFRTFAPPTDGGAP